MSLTLCGRAGSMWGVCGWRYRQPMGLYTCGAGVYFVNNCRGNPKTCRYICVIGFWDSSHKCAINSRHWKGGQLGHVFHWRFYVCYVIHVMCQIPIKFIMSFVYMHMDR